MTSIDLTPLYRNSVGFDRLANMLENTFRSGHVGTSYPPYNIELIDEDHYAVTLAVAGFEKDELDIMVENGVLTIKGKKADEKQTHEFLYQGIATRAFERRFNLADHVEITDAKLRNGLLVIELKHELPEAMKPRRITISNGGKVSDKKSTAEQAA